MNIHAEVYANPVFGKRLAGYAKRLAGNMELLDKKSDEQNPSLVQKPGKSPITRPAMELLSGLEPLTC